MRYLPHTEDRRRAMLTSIGVDSVDALFADVPRQAYRTSTIDLPPHKGEIEVTRALSRMAAKTLSPAQVPSFLGCGNYRHHTPATVDHLIQRGEFLTSYTPYQPEVSQGTLQMLFEFQTQVAELLGMEIANASMYDGATACAEAVLMACRITGRSHAILSGGLHPHYSAVTVTQGQHMNISCDVLPPDPFGMEDLLGRVHEVPNGALACVVVQMPDAFGRLRALRTLAEAVHGAGGLLIAAFTEPAAFGLIEPPGAMGADIVVGDGQSLASPPLFGGPGLGLFATREKFVRQMPGRIAGETLDADGKRGWVLTLSTREQHIRREKATSNICTNSGLLALAFSIHMSLLGQEGLRRLAGWSHARATQVADALTTIPGVRVLPDAFFNEMAVALPKDAAVVTDALASREILSGVPARRLWPSYSELSNVLVLATTELTTDDDIDALVTTLREIL